MLDKRTLETILSDQKEELDAKRHIRFCKRKEESLIDLDSPQAQVIIGVRRSGKSTLCYNALKHAGVKYAYVNFDDERLIWLNSDDLNNVLEVLYKIYGDFRYLFIDEIQNIPEWYLFVNRLLRRGIHIIITGSNAKLLSGELATHLTGRHHPIHLYPFAFAEYCDIRHIDTHGVSTQAIAQRRQAFDEYLKQGGFPELQLIKSERDYIDSLVENILKRDIEQRFKILHKSSFEQMAYHVLNTAPTIISNTAFKELFNLKSEHTTKNYIKYLQEGFLIVGLHKYSQKSRMRIIEEKAYPIDVALMSKRTNAFAKENLGWRLETIIYIELLRRCKSKGLDIYYLRNRSGECDFIVCQGNQAIMAIQVSYDIQNDKTRKREIAGLVLAAKETKCENLVLITDHEYDDVEAGGHKIAIRPAYDYVLSNFI